MMVTTTTQREMIHWLWLWLLAAIAISVMQGVLFGQSRDPAVFSQESPGVPGERLSPSDESGTPIPMPNVDHPEWFRYPKPAIDPGSETLSLGKLLQMHRVGDFEKAVKGWHTVRMAEDSQTWKEVAIGAALLRLDRLDEALEHLEGALKFDPTNAVAEYFLGHVRQAQGRQVPFWYEPDRETPFQLASILIPKSLEPRGNDQEFDKGRGRMLLPHFIDDAYARLAREHFRRAIALAPQCDLEREIRVVAEVPPTLQLAVMKGNAGERVTVGDLVDSFGERDYVRTAITELGMRRENEKP